MYLLDTAKDTFDIILQIGAGTGLLYLVRWFWWRVNAWCEVVAMISSFVVSVLLLVLGRNGVGDEHARGAPHHHRRDDGLLGRDRLARTSHRSRGAVEFYRKVRPSGPGWEPIRKAAGLPVGAAAADNIPLAMLGWTAGCTAIWSALFTVGNLLYMRPVAAAILFVVFVVSTLVAGERHADAVGTG